MITDVPRGTCPGLPSTENHLEFSCNDLVWFSATQHGQAISIHIAAPSRRGKLNIRRCLNEFCEWVFDHYQWCQMIIGMVGPKSVVNLGLKCGFEHADTVGPVHIMVRERP